MSEEPTGEVLDALSFNQKGCQMSFRPMTAQAYEWRNMTSAPSYNVMTDTGIATNKKNTEGTASTTLGFDPTIEPPTVASAGLETDFDEGFFKCDGWNTLCMKGVGLPTADVASQMPVMVVEVILHVEFISSNIGTTSYARPQPHNQAMIDEVARRAAKMPLFRTLFTGTVASANRVVRARNGY